MAIYGKGIYEKGKYKSKINGKHTKEYLVWRTMISRCYNPMYLEKHPTYERCQVCNEWLYFQEFCKWFELNYYEIDGIVVDLDKDILIKGNKIYSPNTCCFIPQEINKLFTLRTNNRGNCLIGVHKHKDLYVSLINKYGKRITIGYFKNEQDAFIAYKREKEKYIKEIADKYKDYISKEVYNSLINWKISIKD